MDELQIEIIDINNEEERNEVKTFLNTFNLNYEKGIDYTVVLREKDDIVATASKSKNILKGFAINEKLQGEGITSMLVSSLLDRLFYEEIYHSFIFTKPQNIDIFSSLGFKPLYKAKKAALLENGIYDIHDHIKKLIKNHNIDITKSRSALVMNCNPFTKGHRYLIEEASKVSNEVLVFIVEEDKSVFPFESRYNMVKEGTFDLENVKVIRGGEYIISLATFPTYFLKEEDDILKTYTDIDAGIFAKYFCKELNIDRRFVGEEPYCNVTRTYNDSLIKQLKRFNIDLTIIPRKSIQGEVISASKVRTLIKHKDINKLETFLPKVTLEFLQTKIGKEIVEDIT
ncbi:citC [citrate (pro-3S)-lyase] ligase [Clostridium putrefaciens]|uniref:[Citrate [pro-3S]-lyase] ligase n=1 Tax=Clostridium putrefaciens TaxID=99675 RepID=A0A381JAC9_9CLOT|nr:[citrate (pro-3S)-lyase] ligase [Clostridium putrefaciens]SUY48214.1 citC [citrate (pro-3S)-lyase] ligase [Clostridium putrefaciens]